MKTISTDPNGWFGACNDPAESVGMVVWFPWFGSRTVYVTVPHIWVTRCD